AVRAAGDAVGVRRIARAGGGGVPVEGVGAGAAVAGGGRAGDREISGRGRPPPDLPRADAGEEAGLLPRPSAGGGGWEGVALATPIARRPRPPPPRRPSLPRRAHRRPPRAGRRRRRRGPGVGAGAADRQRARARAG